MPTLRPIIAAGAALALAGAAHAQHRDVYLELSPDGSAIVTGVYDFDDPQNPVTPDVRVFTRDFGEAGQPDFTDDPGFNALDGSLPPDTLFGVDLIDALRKWDGQDFDQIPPETITIERFGVVATTPATAGGFTEGFWLATTGSDGGFHVHMDYFIDPPGAATPGIYLLTLGLRTDHPTVADPEPIFVVFNFEDPNAETELPAAAAYVESLIAPAPGCPGDVNGDGSTDVFDFAELANGFGAGPGASREMGDLTGDGFVDVFDFAELAEDFGCAG